MFRKKKRENNINGYASFVSKVIKDENIKKEILAQLKIFEKDGIINIDGRNLTGKIIEEDGNLYLDIKCEKGKFICSYTKWDINSMVLIEQETLKSGNYKITKTDKVKYYTNNNENEYSVEIEEKIYNQDGQLLYESENKVIEEFNSYKDKLVYMDDSPFKNVVDVKRTWYMPNGSIIMYRMDKNELYYKRGTEESYMICKKPYKNEFVPTMNFIPLDRDLFISLMAGELTIEEVLEKLEEKAKAKTLEKKNEKSNN